MNSVATTTGAVLLTAVGCLQMAGDLAGMTALKALGAASHASPAPRVFTAHQGFETFSSHFFVQWTDRSGRRHKQELTPRTYGLLQGPYNRRNAYGAALSYGPVLSANPATRPMFEQASRFAVCGSAPALREIGIDPAHIHGPVTLALVPRDTISAASHWQLAFTIHCPQEDAS